MVAIDVIREDLETLLVRVKLTGLIPHERYDVFRLQIRYLGEDDNGNPVYEREFPDRHAYWRGVAHRVGWEPNATTALFRDYEVSLRPTLYYVCLSSARGPQEWDFHDGPYPVSRGVLDNEVVHFNRDLHEAIDAGRDAPHIAPGDIFLRSTEELNHWHAACVVDFDSVKYTARGTEHTVLGTQYPVFVSDIREARRGTVTIMVHGLGQLNEIRRIVYPVSGQMQPVIFNGGGEPTLLLDDMVVLPLDVTVEQVTAQSPKSRYVHIDFIEINPGKALMRRTGDDDALVDEPNANFSISDTTPARNQWVTLTDTSTGQYDTWDWWIERGDETDNKHGKFYTRGPHRVRWRNRGKKTVKLRVYGSGGGAATRTRTITVH